MHTHKELAELLDAGPLLAPKHGQLFNWDAVFIVYSIFLTVKQPNMPLRSRMQEFLALHESERESFREDVMEAFASETLDKLYSRYFSITPSNREGLVAVKPRGRYHEIVAAFKTQFLKADVYVGALCEALDKLVDRGLLPAEDYMTPMEGYVPSFCHVLPLLQSDGFGKSRISDELAKFRITLPFILRGPVDGAAYPPTDEEVRAYLHRNHGETDRHLSHRYAAFLIAAFTSLRIILKANTHPHCSYECCAFAWYSFLSHPDPGSRTSNRGELYKQICWAAEAIHKSVETPKDTRAGVPGVLTNDLKASLDATINTIQPNGNAKKIHAELSSTVEPIIQDLANRLIPLSRTFSEVVHTSVHEGHSRPTGAALLVISIDEAHFLMDRVESNVRSRSAYHVLTHVLSLLKLQPLATIVMSTDLRLGQVSPSSYFQPPERDKISPAQSLVPPFTELPFDVFASDTVHSGLTLTDVGKVEFIVQFGRPLWASLYGDGNGDLSSTILEFAAQKLCCQTLSQPSLPKAAALAVASRRMLLNFNPARHDAKKLLEEAVERHMHVLLAFPAHLEFAHAGTPSEPILAEAAGRVMARYPCTILDSLFEALSNGLVEGGDPGELAHRFLLIMAYDDVLGTIRDPLMFDRTEPQWHVPIKLLEFLRHLFSPPIFDKICNSTPQNAPGEPFSETFKNAWIHFSHFAPAYDDGVFGSQVLMASLARGMAIQCSEDPAEIDSIVPACFGKDVPLVPTNLTFIAWQQKNRVPTSTPDAVQDMFASRGFSNPFCFIQQDFGTSEEPDIVTQDPTSESHHPYAPGCYVFHVKGRDERVYRVLKNRPRRQKVLDAILTPGNVFRDHPRAASEKSMEALVRMQPGLLDTKESWDWVKDYVAGDRTKGLSATKGLPIPKEDD
ncbi:hypothetical protein JAAARDRAFT_190117 [Jaapia argillacea MUCL 33604]|uniref:Uncharacterized protein n=1 Tax=Jaapia argillacea MUCL 33604 TaxID=933084 RepID=A0A067Q2P1_9AGAM|nr:hypothetical protein JAAARDRAFT_190117 [Jaapia argillacea MUCL 33604]